MENIQWVFSGIGVFVIGGIINYIIKKKNKVKGDLLSHKIEGTLSVTIPNNDQINNLSKDNNPIQKLYNKIIQVFDEHNIPIQQIPKFIDPIFDIKYSDLQNQNCFIKKITPELIDWISMTFNIKKDWIEDRSEHIYETINVYKFPIFFRDLIVQIIKDNGLEYSYRNDIDVYIFKEDIEFKGDETSEYTYIQFIIQVKINSINNINIYKYYIIRNNLYWHYWKSRRDSKIIIAICNALNINMHGYNLEHNVLSKLGAGCEFPEKYIRECRGYTWYPEDYIDNFNVHENEKKDNSLNDINLKEIMQDTRRIIEELKEDYFDRIKK